MDFCVCPDATIVQVHTLTRDGDFQFVDETCSIVYFYICVCLSGHTVFSRTFYRVPEYLLHGVVTFLNISQCCFERILKNNKPLILPATFSILFFS